METGAAYFQAAAGASINPAAEYSLTATGSGLEAAVSQLPVTAGASINLAAAHLLAAAEPGML